VLPLSTSDSRDVAFSVRFSHRYEKARELDAKAKTLSLTWRRVLVDELIPSYGISGNLKKAHALAEEAAMQDPDYPINYYNLACAFAEEGNKAKTLENISRAFQHKNNVLPGEQMPNPRSDDSFKNFLGDGDFIKLMQQLGYN
jgi:tetratricopeptide (TPR) repeat protein